MFAVSVSNFLEKNGFGVIDSTLFIDAFPSRLGNTDNAICVYNTPSYSIRGRARNSVDFTCQIRVRDNDNEQAMKKAYEIYNLLETNKSFEDGMGKRFTIRPLNPPNFLMYDESNRANWILNMTALALNY